MVNIGIGECLIALQNLLQVGIDLELALSKRVKGDISGRNTLCCEPLPVYGSVEILGFGEIVQLADIFHKIGAEPGMGTCRLCRIGSFVGQCQKAFRTGRTAALCAVCSTLCTSFGGTGCLSGLCCGGKA